MAEKQPSMIGIMVLGVILTSDVSDAKCTCCKEINDYCCETKSERTKDACCDSNGDINNTKIHDWSMSQCPQNQGSSDTVWPSDDCKNKPCGTYCFLRIPGECDGNGNCVDWWTNPCRNDGKLCDGKKCGDACLIESYCDNNLYCNPRKKECENEDCKKKKCGDRCKIAGSDVGITFCDSQGECLNAIWDGLVDC